MTPTSAPRVFEPGRPFSVAWQSMKLYRVTADHGPAGKDVDIDGWEDALDEAWRQVAILPGVIAWLTAYVHARG